MPSLHEAVLLSSTVLVQKWAGESRNSQRFQGLAPIHIAVLRPKMLRMLVSAGHNVDTLDSCGYTPLFYAATLGLRESALILLKAGADMNRTNISQVRFWLAQTPSSKQLQDLDLVNGGGCRILTRDTAVLIIEARLRLYDHSPLQQALFNRHREIVMDCLDHDRSVGLIVIVQCLQLDTDFTVRMAVQLLKDKVAPTNLTISYRSAKRLTLLHLVKHGHILEALLESGFDDVQGINSYGQHALMTCGNDHGLIHQLINKGCPVDTEDTLGHTALYYRLNDFGQRFVEQRFPSDRSALIALLTGGADALHRDGCRCSCSPTGCLPHSHRRWDVFGPRRDFHRLIIIVEYLSLLEEYRRSEDAEYVLHSLVREAIHRDLGMTHVCCRGTEALTSTIIAPGYRLPDEDVEQILDEESEFIAILEEKMDQHSDLSMDSLFDQWLLLSVSKNFRNLRTVRRLPTALPWQDDLNKSLI